MSNPRSYYVYIVTNRSGTLYLGVTNNLARRLGEHARASSKRFAGRYACTRLVYLEVLSSPAAAIAREKQLKGWVRRKKVALINAANPGWNDLAELWGLRSEHRAAGGVAPEPDPSLRSG
jgi:putative endonuclease